MKAEGKAEGEEVCKCKNKKIAVREKRTSEANLCNLDVIKNIMDSTSYIRGEKASTQRNKQQEWRHKKSFKKINKKKKERNRQINQHCISLIHLESMIGELWGMPIPSLNGDLLERRSSLACCQPMKSKYAKMFKTLHAILHQKNISFPLFYSAQFTSVQNLLQFKIPLMSQTLLLCYIDN